MSDEPQDDVLELGEENLVHVEQQGDDTQPAAEAEDDIELPAFGDAAEDEDGDSELARKLRALIRDRDKELKDLKSEKAPPPEIVVGDEPVWDDNEDKWNWDGKEFAAAHREWESRKHQAEEQANKKTEAQSKADEEWRATLASYAAKRTVYPAAAMEEAEDKVAATLTPVQQARLVDAADNPAKLIIALSRNQAKLDALASVTNDNKFAALVAKMEGEVKMVRRKPSVDPDVPQRGSAPASASSVDKKLEELEKEAARTNNRSKVVAYKEELKRKAA